MTSWEDVGGWYNSLVGKEGHYYHKHVIFPKLLSLLDIQAGHKILDLGCGQAAFVLTLPKGITYHGIDLSPTLVEKAPKRSYCSYLVADACKPLAIEEHSFTHSTMILSLQNMEDQAAVVKNAARALKPGGIFIIVLNHPCFRIPRQTHWQIDENQKLQYRRVNRYLSPLTIPITLANHTTYSFHHSLSDYSQFLYDAGFRILKIEEWTSDKKSTGKAAKMENFARQEFPLFLTLKCIFHA